MEIGEGRQTTSQHNFSLKKMQPTRPLAHLAGQHLLCSGWLSTWRDSTSSLFKEFCIQGVDCRDWDTGQKVLAHLDHAWMRVLSSNWKTFHKLGVLDEGCTSRLDQVLFVARPEYYRRTNGSKDWGLYLLSSPPTTQRQANKVYQEFCTLSKPNRHLSHSASQFQQFVITARLLELKLEDWRLYSHQGPQQAQWACKVARRNAEAGLRHQYSTLQLAKRAAHIRSFCQRRAELLLAGDMETVARRLQSNATHL